MNDLNRGTKHCGNCDEEINLACFMMHEAFCTRNKIKCDICLRVYDKNLKTDHFDEFHKKLKCDQCDETIEQIRLNEHKSDLCPRRKYECFYCKDLLLVNKLNEHLTFCGARTELCELCGKYIQLQNQFSHELYDCRNSNRRSDDPNNNPNSNGSSKSSSKREDLIPDDSDLSESDMMYESRMINEAAATEDELVPCEFCFAEFPFVDILGHQLDCQRQERI